MTKTIRNIALVAVAIVLVAAGCSNYDPAKAGSQAKSQAITESYYKTLSEKVPYPVDQMKDSVELRNLREKLLRFNKPDKIGYVYTFSYSGEVIDFYTIKGKVSSTDSQMTVSDQTQYICQTKPALKTGEDPNRIDNMVCAWATTKSPGDDASFGSNEGGVFFFTTEDVYVSFSSTTIWRYYDAPIKVDSVTHRSEGIADGSKPSSVGESTEQRQK